jgi:Hint domain
LLTPSGERKIEDLRIGDLLTTLNGEAKPIQWIGRRVYRRPTGSSYPESVLPIRVARRALGPGEPHCDLFVSQRHCLWIDGLLIQAVDLVKGSSIAIVSGAELSEIEYLHVKLAQHDVIFAEVPRPRRYSCTPETSSDSTTSQSTYGCVERRPKNLPARRSHSKMDKTGFCRACGARCLHGSIVATSSIKLAIGSRNSPTWFSPTDTKERVTCVVRARIRVVTLRVPC